MALNRLFCADVPLSNYSHSLTSPISTIADSHRVQQHAWEEACDWYLKRRYRKWQLWQHVQCITLWSTYWTGFTRNARLCWRHPTRRSLHLLSRRIYSAKSSDASRRTGEADAIAVHIRTIITCSSWRWLRKADTRKSAKDTWAKREGEPDRRTGRRSDSPNI